MHSLSWGIFKMAATKKYEKLQMGFSIPQLLIIIDTQTLSLNICFGKYDQIIQKLFLDHLRAQNLRWLPMLAQKSSSTSNALVCYF